MIVIKVLICGFSLNPRPTSIPFPISLSLALSLPVSTSPTALVLPHIRIFILSTHVATMKCDGVELRFVFLRSKRILPPQIFQVAELEHDKLTLGNSENHGKVLKTEVFRLLNQKEDEHECGEIQTREDGKPAPVLNSVVELGIA